MLIITWCATFLLHTGQRKSDRGFVNRTSVWSKYVGLIFHVLLTTVLVNYNIIIYPFTDTVREIMLSVAESFVTIATWLEHDKGTVAMDSTFHHCWPLPPLSETTPTSREGSTCKCGAVTSSMLPGDSLLTKVMGGDYLYLTDDKISETVFPLNWPRVADCYVTKLRASELAGDIASTVLRTAWVVVATSTD